MSAVELAAQALHAAENWTEHHPLKPATCDLCRRRAATALGAVELTDSQREALKRKVRSALDGPRLTNTPANLLAHVDQIASSAREVIAAEGCDVTDERTALVLLTVIEWLMGPAVDSQPQAVLHLCALSLAAAQPHRGLLQ